MKHTSIQDWLNKATDTTVFRKAKLYKGESKFDSLQSATAVQNWLDKTKVHQLHKKGYKLTLSHRKKISKSVTLWSKKNKRIKYFYQGLGLRDWVIKNQLKIKNWSRKQLREHLTPMCPQGKKHYDHSIGDILKECNLNLKKMKIKRECMANYKIFDSITSAANHLNINESLVRRRIKQNRDGYRILTT